MGYESSALTDFLRIRISSFREKTFNDSDAHPSSGVPVSSSQYARKDDKDADDFAVRLSSFSGDWDLAGSVFYGTARDPILSISSDGSALNPYYALQKSIGFEAQYTGNVTLFKWESLHGTQRIKKKWPWTWIWRPG